MARAINILRTPLWIIWNVIRRPRSFAILRVRCRLPWSGWFEREKRRPFVRPKSRPRPRTDHEWPIYRDEDWSEAAPPDSADYAVFNYREERVTVVEPCERIPG